MITVNQIEEIIKQIDIKSEYVFFGNKKFEDEVRKEILNIIKNDKVQFRSEE